MKKLLIFLLFFGVFTGNIYAVSPTPKGSGSPTTTQKSKSTPTPTLTQEAVQIEKIKDLVASKVAELKLVDKRGLLGTVKSTSNTQIILTTTKDKEVMIDIDELTKFEDDSESFGISDIKKGDSISAVGLFNKDTERLLARYVSYASNVPENFSGAVISHDKENFTLTVTNATGDKKTIDVQSSTKTASFEGGETVKSGFSKIEEGERIIIVGFADTKEKDQINASRIIRLPETLLSTELKNALESSTGASKSKKEE